MEKQSISPTIDSRFQTKWLAPAVGVFLCVLVALLWLMLNNKKNNDNYAMIQVEAEKMTGHISADLRNRVSSIQRIVRRWEIHKGRPKEEFTDDIQTCISDMPGFQAIAWADRTYQVKWITPAKENELAKDMDLGFEEKRRIALEKARSLRAPTMTSPVELVQGGKGFLIYFPIFLDEKFDGFIVAIFRTQEWLANIFDLKHIPQHLKHFKITVSMDGFIAYQEREWDALKTDYEAATTVALDHRFTVQLRPTEGFFLRNRTVMNEVIIAGGFLLSVFVAFMVFLSQKATEEAWRTRATKQSLEAAISELNATKNELQYTNARLTLATKAGNVGIWEWEIANDKLTWNDVMYEIYDVPPDVLPTYRSWQTRLHPDDAGKTEALLNNAVMGTAKFDTEFRIVLPGGTVRHIRTAARVERDSSGIPLRIVGVNLDITERKKSEELLAYEKRRLSDILEGTNVGTWEWNIKTSEIIFNERWAGIIGYSLEELTPLSVDTWTRFVHPDDLQRFFDLLQKHLRKESDHYECETRMHHKNGSWVWVLDRAKVTTWTEDGRPLIMSGTHQDITERKQAEEKIQHLATHDVLTDLPSLMLAKDHAQMAIQIAQRNNTSSAIMFIDLDGFKKINDAYGHDAGDAVLKTVAKRLLSCVRKTDTVARIGGDEFLVILTELYSLDNANQVAAKIVESVSQLIYMNETQITVGASVGIALYPGNGEDVESLIKQADSAMYKVKSAGKNGYSFVGSRT